MTIAVAAAATSSVQPHEGARSRWKGIRLTGESRGEVGWSVTGGKERIEHARGGQTAHQRCPFDGCPSPPTR